MYTDPDKKKKKQSQGISKPNIYRINNYKNYKNVDAAK